MLAAIADPREARVGRVGGVSLCSKWGGDDPQVIAGLTNFGALRETTIDLRVSPKLCQPAATSSSV
jgi:hypothetical protein